MGRIADTADRFAAEGAVLHFRAKIETVGDAEINSPLQKLLLQLFRGNNERGDPAVRVPPCIGRNQLRKDKFTDCRIGTDTDHRNIRQAECSQNHQNYFIDLSQEDHNISVESSHQFFMPEGKT